MDDDRAGCEGLDLIGDCRQLLPIDRDSSAASSASGLLSAITATTVCPCQTARSAAISDCGAER